MDKEEIINEAKKHGLDIKEFPTSVKKMEFLTKILTKEIVLEFSKEINECGFFDDYDKNQIKAHFSNFLTLYALGKGLHKK